MIFTSLEAYWWDPVFYFKKNHYESPPSVGGRKYPQNDPQKGCAIIAQCAGVGESHLWIFFLRLRFPYIKATFEGVLGKKNWAQDFPIVLVPPNITNTSYFGNGIHPPFLFILLLGISPSLKIFYPSFWDVFFSVWYFLLSFFNGSNFHLYMHNFAKFAFKCKNL